MVNVDDPVLKISLPGVPVEQASPEECAIHTGFSVPKIDGSRQNYIDVNVTFNNETPGFSGSQQTQITLLDQIEHQYDYTPQLWLHCEYLQQSGGVGTLTFGPGQAFLGAATILDTTYFRVRADSKYIYLELVQTNGLATTDIIAVKGTSLLARIYIMVDGVGDTDT